jgi:alkylhydroperoxidase family enzyme
MQKFVEKYKLWLDRELKALRCSRWPEAAILLSRFQCLELRESLFGALDHSTKLNAVFVEFSNERQNLRWLEKLVHESSKWKLLFESTIRATQMSQEEIVEALVESQIDIEFAVNLS